MAYKDGGMWRARKLGSLVVRAAALCVFVSAFPLPVGSDDMVRTGVGEAPPMSGARIRLREGVAPEATEGGAGAGASQAGWSDQGLEEKVGSTAAGGTTVHLRGRYRTSAVLVRDGNGAVSTECIANPPARGRLD